MSTTIQPSTDPTEHVDETPDNTAGENAGEELAPPLQFPSLDQFVEGLVARVYERATGSASGAKWCPAWWMHDEAVFRLTALWQAWESMRLAEGPTGTAKWLTHYADPIMSQLMSPTGPFAKCSSDRGHDPHPPHHEALLPCEPAPEGLFEPR
ncbi:DUF4913 domain-containing protein [Actinomyces faecalis]|uniref:DUF4913 domain-containing protein n=1 Tax=Actinomyces faecalis TaxID=2722820 RepID=UPI0015572491|nr:DUF4913 domain-containing protein [Actinomyces faecalis]